jgi:hypothetical protein
LKLFIRAKTDHWCAKPEIYSDWSSETWRNLSQPILKNGKLDQCHMFDLDWNELYQRNNGSISQIFGNIFHTFKIIGFKIMHIWCKSLFGDFDLVFKF